MPIGKDFRKKKITTTRTARKTARFQGSSVPRIIEIHSGGSRLTESITHPTRTGGIRSRILLIMLEKHDQEKNFQ